MLADKQQKTTCDIACYRGSVPQMQNGRGGVETVLTFFLLSLFPYAFCIEIYVTGVSVDP